MSHTKHIAWPLLLAALALFIARPGAASAHAELASSVPAAGASVESAPERVTATFDNHDALDATSKLVVTDASGAVVDMGDAALDKADADRKTLAVSLKPGLGASVYTVSWTAVSTGDGSSEEGSFTFTVTAAGSTAAPAAGTTAAAPTNAALPRTGGEDLPLALVAGAAGLLLGAGRALRRRAR